MKKMMSYLLLLLCFVSSLCFAQNNAVILSIDGPIGPATQDYIHRGISYAKDTHANAIIIEMNTPGGLETSTRGINEAIIASSIPVITYVAPAGARAASAGTYIMYASHVAAMAPGTNVGAASPVSMGPDASKEKSDKPSTMDKKIMNDSIAYIKSLAQLRDRNIDWATKAVREAHSISAMEAKRLNVINFIADDVNDVLQKASGMKVKIEKNLVTLDLKTDSTERFEPDWRYKILSFVTDPSITYILILIAMYGLFFELSNPGLLLPGVAGLISLLLVLYAFQIMPLNFVGLALLLIGIAFLIAEVYVSSFGALGIGGAIAFIIGSIMLFDVNEPNYQLATSLIVLMSAITLTFFLMVISLAIRSHKRAVVTGREALIGSDGVVISVMNEQIIVRVQGEIWEARSTEMLDIGQPIRVVGVSGLLLRVIGKGET